MIYSTSDLASLSLTTAQTESKQDWEKVKARVALAQESVGDCLATPMPKKRNPDAI